MHTVAVTGASGYIGRHLVAQLRQQGNLRIKILTRQKDQSLPASQLGSRVEIVQGNLFIPDSLKNFLEPGCTVVHLAYLQGGEKRENLAATVNLIEACRKAEIKRLIHCSTAAVVGRVADNMITEETVCRPLSEYGITKLEIENTVVASGNGNFDIGILRPTSVFGPEGGSLKKLIGNLTARKTLRNYLKSCLFNKRRMNLVHVVNVVAAIIFMIEYEKNLDGGIFIVSEDDNSKNNFGDVEHFLMKHLGLKGYPVPPFPIPLELLSFLLSMLGRNNVNPLCNYDPHKLLDLGFRRPVEFEAGLRNYSNWYRSTGH